MPARFDPARRRRVPRTGLLALFAIACLTLSLTSCNGPQGPAVPSSEPAAFDGSFDGTRLEFRLDAPDGSPSGLTLVAQAFSFEDGTHLLHADVALRNDGSSPVPGPESVLVYGFVPADIVPQNASCSDGNPSLPYPHCSFDHRGTYGDTGLLGPGESSTPVEWILLVPSGESFAFRAQLGAPEPGPGTIAGIVYADNDRDGSLDAGELGIEGVQVSLRAGSQTVWAWTDALGHYAFSVAAPGLYELSIAVPPGDTPTTPLPLQVAILQRDDGSLGSFTLGDIGLAHGFDEPFVQLQGLAYHDLNRNGIYDEGEPGIAGVEIQGEACNNDDDDDDDDGDDAKIADIADSSHGFKTITDPDGRWVLLLPDCGGPWSVRASSVDGWDRTSPKSVVFYAVSPDEILVADFGYAPEDPSSHWKVRGVVYHDQNRNGIRDPYEPGVRGVVVTAAGLGCARPAATDVTDSKGRYEINGDEILCPLPWRVERGPIAGVLGTTPAVLEIGAPPVHDGKFVVDFGVAPPLATSATSGPAAISAPASR